MSFPDPVELPINGILDLHTFQPSDVKDLLPSYLNECRRRGIHQVRIIHGKGSGTLRHIVRLILEKMPYVVSFSTVEENAGGWGATTVILLSITGIDMKKKEAR